MKYDRTISFQSEYDPEISVTLKKPSYGDKIELDAATEPFRSKVRDISKRQRAIEDKLAPLRRAFDREKQQSLAAAKNAPDPEAAVAEANASTFDMPSDLLFEMRDLNMESLRVTALDYNPALLRWGVVDIRGLVIDDQPAGIEELIAKGPEHLTYEIIGKIEEVRGMSGEQLKNSSLPSISSSPADGKTSATTAASADNPASISPEIAVSTSTAADTN